VGREKRGTDSRGQVKEEREPKETHEVGNGKPSWNIAYIRQAGCGARISNEVRFQGYKRKNNFEG